MDAVERTLKEWRTTPFVYGSSDCLLSIGDHIARQGGQDVASRFRGLYDDEDGARAFSDAAGGAIDLIDATGLKQIGSPVRGSVIVINLGVPNGLAEPIPGLCTGSGFAARLVRGVVEIDLRFVRIMKAWQCPL